MRHFHVCSLALSLVVFLATQLPGQEKPYSLEICDHVVSISVRDDSGIPIQEFIKLAERVTGKAFTYSELSEDDTRIEFVGDIHLEPDGFFQFFQTMLYLQGYACILRGEGDDELVEIVKMQGPTHTRGDRRGDTPIYIAPANLTEYADRADVTIITVMSLEHLELQQAINALRPFLVGREDALTAGNVGNSNSLLLQGSGPRVYLVSRVIGLIDVPAPRESTMRVIQLEHAAAEEIRGLLEGLLAARRPEFKIVSHGDDALIVSGDQGTVATVLELISLLDR